MKQLPAKKLTTKELEKLDINKISYIIQSKDITINLGTKVYRLSKLDVRVPELLVSIKAFNDSKQASIFKEIEKILSPVQTLELDSKGLFTLKEGSIYYKNTDVIIPQKLVDHISDTLKSKRDIVNLCTFWENCMENPDSNVRDRVFDFIQHEGCSITDTGCIVAYKKVFETTTYKKPQIEIKLSEIKKGEEDTYINSKKLFASISNRIEKYKKNKKGYRDIAVYIDQQGEYFFFNPDSKPNNLKARKLGNIISLFEKISKEMEKNKQGLKDAGKLQEHNVVDRTFTDSHTRTFRIELLTPVRVDRALCDSRPDEACSYGLHIGGLNYVKNFTGDTTLICIVNPKNIVSVPYADASKMRVCEYLPYDVIDGNSFKIERYMETQDLFTKIKK